MNPARTLYFDIETAPLPAEQLEGVQPEFEPALNLKDPVKIAADLERKRTRWIEDAALSPVTGRVLAIGFAYDDGPVQVIDGEPEDLMLAKFWNVFAQGRSTMRLCGFCIGSFDLPFLFQRSWHHKLEPPLILRHGRYWGERVVDLFDVWCLGQRDMGTSLDMVARTLGLPQKLGNGKDFHRLYTENYQAAMEYLTRDIEITRALAQRIEPTLVMAY